jgi:hypothetical protein
MRHAAIPSIQKIQTSPQIIPLATDGRIRQFLALFSIVKRRFLNEGILLFSFWQIIYLTRKNLAEVGFAKFKLHNRLVRHQCIRNSKQV